MAIVDDQNNPLTIAPSCAFDQITDPATGVPLDNSFHFFFKEGSSDNLMVFFNGGGSCWNDETCVASLALAQVPGARSTYNPSIYVQNSPQGAGGIFDDTNDANPFKDWDKVFIPYCTGDLHMGSSEVDYVDTTGAVTGYPGASLTVKHHGFDNMMAVREWIKTTYASSHSEPDKLLLTGSSGGGYGASITFPYMSAVFPNAQTTLFADGSAGIATSGFVEDVFTAGNNWNLEHTLPPLFYQLLGSYNAPLLNAQFFWQLSYQYPQYRFAQYTTEKDLVQVQFLKIMDQIDKGNTDPLSWGLGTDPIDVFYILEWKLRAESSFSLISSTTSNYQYYIGLGTMHTVLTNAFATPEIPQPFYMESSAGGVLFTQWLENLVYANNFVEQSLKPTRRDRLCNLGFSRYCP